MLSKVEGKEIITAEGLSEREKEVYSYAFATAGAVQCGFCIPGMVMCAKGLIDRNPDPTRLEVVAAIRNNICRCTGYKKIIDGILLSAKILRGGSAGTRGERSSQCRSGDPEDRRKGEGAGYRRISG